LAGIAADGSVCDLQPSTLGTPQALQAVEPAAVTEVAIESIYLLSPLEIDPSLQRRLSAGEVFQFCFNYSAVYRSGCAFLLANAEGIFALTGTPLTPVWSEPGLVAVADSADDSGDDLDFDMF